MTELAAYFCENSTRRLALQRSTGALNGIDYLEVVDRFAGLPRQQVLLVHFFKPLAARQLGASNVVFTGGSVTAVTAVWAYRGNEIRDASSASGLPGLLAAELIPLQMLLAALPPGTPREALFVVRTDRRGDFAPYKLRLVFSQTNAGAPPQIDVQLRAVQFSFKVECPSDLDCAPLACSNQTSLPVAPELDYATRDYAGFRQLMLDRLAVTSPGLLAQNLADMPVLLVELLAHAADKLSYFQDAVATEAYLKTARRRRSVRRHARLLDYTVREGSNARTFVQIQVHPGSAATIQKGLRLLTSSVVGASRLDERDVEVAVAAGAPVFETMHELEASSVLNEREFYTWGDDGCCLPRGATHATLDDTNGELAAWFAGRRAEGTLLALVEQRGPQSGIVEDADPLHRHVVRLKRLTPGVDPLFAEPGQPGQPQRIAEIEWSLEDALPFALRIGRVVREGAAAAVRISSALGNIVLADHGLTVSEPELRVAAGRPFRPALTRTPLTWQGQVLDPQRRLVPFDPTASARAALKWDPSEVRPAINVLDDQDGSWRPRRDLLESDALENDFVVETEDDGRVELRFGDGELGRLPQGTFRVTYRIGSGVDGNVGADAITHFVAPAFPTPPILKVNNPVPARGGAPAESLEQIRTRAPRAFAEPLRAVTEADYARAAERHPEVQRAHATRRFTGSWVTVFIDIDRLGGRAIDAAFREELTQLLEPLRLAGHEFAIREARFVPVQVQLSICVGAGFLRADVRSRLLEAFSTRTLADGRFGFFHPDRFSFGQPLHLSDLLAAARQVLGVAYVDTSDRRLVFQRADRSSAGVAPRDPEFQVIHVAAFEIIRADNDVNRPQNGRIDFELLGGA